MFKYYVYEWYIDLEQGQESPVFHPSGVFYVGKGKDNRMYAHPQLTRAKMKRGRAGVMKLSAKEKVFLMCWDRGYNVKCRKVFETWSEDSAFDVETRLIEEYGLERLTNETYGRKKRPIPTRRRVRAA